MIYAWIVNCIYLTTTRGILAVGAICMAAVNTFSHQSQVARRLSFCSLSSVCARV